MLAGATLNTGDWRKSSLMRKQKRYAIDCTSLDMWRTPYNPDIPQASQVSRNPLLPRSAILACLIHVDAYRSGHGHTNFAGQKTTLRT